MYQLNGYTVNFGLDLDFGYRDSGFLSVEFGFGIPIVSGIPVSLSLNSKAQDSTSKTLPESVIQISLHGALKYDFTERKNLWADGVGFLKIEGKADRTAKGW